MAEQTERRKPIDGNKTMWNPRRRTTGRSVAKAGSAHSPVAWNADCFSLWSRHAGDRPLGRTLSAEKRAEQNIWLDSVESKSCATSDAPRLRQPQIAAVQGNICNRIGVVQYDGTVCFTHSIDLKEKNAALSCLGAVQYWGFLSCRLQAAINEKRE
jgi:hypothetical protein